MGLYQAATGELITAARWNTIYNLLKGVAGGEDTIRLANNVTGTLRLQPNSNPASPVRLFDIRPAGGATTYFALRSDGVPVLCDKGGDPGSLEDGMLWRNGSKFYGRLGGATVELFTPAAASIIYATRLASDLTSTATALANATGLSFAVEANKDYRWDADLTFRSAATTTGIHLAVSGPASPTSCCCMIMIADGGTSQADWGTGYDNGQMSAAVYAADTDYPARLSGIFRNGANAGTFILRFASEVAASQVTIKAGSVIRWQQLN